MSSYRAAQRSAADAHQPTIGGTAHDRTPASYVMWIVDDAGPFRTCRAHPRSRCHIGGQAAEHAVCPSTRHTLCGRSVDYLLTGSDPHPRMGVWMTTAPTWPRAQRCVECQRRLITAGLVDGPGDPYRHVCTICRYTIARDDRRPMAGVRSTEVRAILGAGVDRT